MATNFQLLKILTIGRKVIQRIRWEWVRYFKTGDDRADQLAEQIVLSVVNSSPDMFILRTGQWMLRWKLMETDQVLAFAMRGHAQNRLTECSPDAQRLFERIVKSEYPCRLLVCLLYTKRILSDHRFTWIRKTDTEWAKLVQAARNEPADIIVKQTI